MYTVYAYNLLRTYTCSQSNSDVQVCLCAGHQPEDSINPLIKLLSDKKKAKLTGEDRLHMEFISQVKIVSQKCLRQTKQLLCLVFGVYGQED